MIEVLDPLAVQPGVILAALVSDDGVPVAVPGVKADDSGIDCGAFADSDALAAICAGWLDELRESVALLSCDAPRRVVMRAARGTLLLLKTSGAVLLVVLEPGLGPDELWLPMEGVAARIQRILRGMGEAPVSEVSGESEPPGALPRRENITEIESPVSSLELRLEGDDSVGN